MDCRMDPLRCLVLIVAFGACHCAFGDFEKNAVRVRVRGDQTVKRPVEKVHRNITRIIGGETINEPVPYQVSIQVLAYITWKHVCGGSILGKNHVLTAAHCVDRLRPERMSILAGTNNLKQGGYRHNVAAYKKHPSYNNKGFLTNDVAIIKVTTSFQLNQKTIAPISLADNTGVRIENNYPVTLTGWGTISVTNQGTTPDKLMVLHYNTITNNECRNKGYKVTPNEICTLFGKNKGACVGDSGGPLVNRARNAQIGIVSYGSTTCASGYPDVFTRVSNFLPWIRKVVQTELP